MKDYTTVLDFWFNKTKPRMWFVKDLSFDKKIIETFTELYTEIRSGNLTQWEKQPESMLATIIVLDQFSRNMFRDTPQAFATDKKALLLAKKAIQQGFDTQVKQGRNFFYMPFMHAENLADQETCINLFKKMARENNKDEATATTYAIQHRDIIKRFGRFPHRNNILGRTSTQEEIAFLKEPHSSF